MSITKLEQIICFIKALTCKISVGGQCSIAYLKQQKRWRNGHLSLLLFEQTPGKATAINSVIRGKAPVFG